MNFITGCSSVRIRKNINKLTTIERNDLAQAMRRFKNSDEYQNIASYHNAYLTLSQNFPCGCEHTNRLFTLWHTAYINKFEDGLGRYLEDENLGLPYLDWTDPDGSTAFDWEAYVNSNTWSRGLKFRNRQFSNGPLPAVRSSTFAEQIRASASSWANDVATMHCERNYNIFNSRIEDIHNTVHLVIGGERGDMSSVSRASFDPIFWLHHNFVEKVFDEWQLCRSQAGQDQWHQVINSGVRNLLDNTLSCFNNPNIINRNDRMYNITPLQLIGGWSNRCHRYEDSNCRCSASSGVQRHVLARGQQLFPLQEEHMPVITDFLNARLYLVFRGETNLAGIFKFDICVTDIEDNYSKQVSKVAGSGQLVFFASEMSMNATSLESQIFYDITEIIEPAKVSLDSKITIQPVSFENFQGNSLEVNRMDLNPLNYFKPNNRTDIYRVFWGTKYKQDILRIEVGTELEFYGAPKDDRFLREFRNRNSFKNCRISASRRIWVNRVRPEVGHHYYLNGNAECGDDQKMHVEVYAKPPSVNPIPY